MKRVVTLAVVFWTSAAIAGPDTSLRPQVRPGSSPVIAQSGAIEPAPRAEEAGQTVKARGLFNSLRPLLRSRKAQKEAKALQKRRARGAVCGDLAVQGDVVGPVKGKLRGCGVENAVRVRSVSGVTLSQQSVMDCTTAKALKTWINNSAKPALARQGGGLKTIKVVAHYACRTRNNQKGAKISEHGRGRAIDISAFTLQNGRSVTVLKGWHAKSTSRALRQMHKGACGPFGTVLGPNANRFHRDHFHFDTARYRSGSYCR